MTITDFFKGDTKAAVEKKKINSDWTESMILDFYKENKDGYFLNKKKFKEIHSKLNSNDNKKREE